MERARVTSPLWLTHHWEDQHGRCMGIGSFRVCRRCAVLYPTAILAAAAVMVLEPSRNLAIAAMWLLPLPMCVEWMLEDLDRVRYSPTRQTALTAIAALGIGAALAFHLRRPFDPDALAPMATALTACGASSILAHRRRRADSDATTPEGQRRWEREHERDEANRRAALRDLLAVQERESRRAD